MLSVLSLAVADSAVTPVTQAITFAIVGGFFTILTLVLTNRSKRQSEEREAQAKLSVEDLRIKEKASDRQAQIDKEARDYAREDLVARRADERSEALLRTTTMAVNTSKKVVEMTADNTDRLNTVHFLVNSNLTAHYESKLATLKISLALAKEVAELQRTAGREPSPGTLATIQATEVEIAELEQTIIDRKVTDAKAAEMMLQPTQDREAANLQVEAAAQQQDAASKQQAAADQITGSLEGAAAAIPTPLPPPPIPA